MAFAAKDASGNTIYIASSGTGTVNDPIVPSQAVTGPLTDAQLRAADVNVSLDGESVAVTGPLTDAQLRAADVAVTLDGEAVAVTGPLTDTQLRAAVVLVGPVDSATGVLMTIDYAHHEAHSGSSFYYHDVITPGNGATQDYLITTPDTTKWAHFGMEIDANDGSLTMELYEACDRTGTTPQTAFNRNRNSLTEPTVAIHKGQSGGTTNGTRILWKRLGTGKTAGGSAGTAEERILKQNTKYLLRLTNNATITNNVSVVLRWYEHTNK